MMLRNLYGVDMGTSGLIIQAQSRGEILADKFVALALRPNRIKNRDLWDIGWLNQQGVSLPFELIAGKVRDHRSTFDEFSNLLRDRIQQLQDISGMQTAFIGEMRIFLPPIVVRETIEKEDFWLYLAGVIQQGCVKVIDFSTRKQDGSIFKM